MGKGSSKLTRDELRQLAEKSHFSDQELRDLYRGWWVLFYCWCYCVIVFLLFVSLFGCLLILLNFFILFCSLFSFSSFSFSPSSSSSFYNYYFHFS